MCTESQISVITRRVAELAKTVFTDKLRSVILYGSYARGDYDEESDVDIMVLADFPREELWHYNKRFAALTSELGLEYNVLVTATLKDTATFDKYFEAVPFYQNVQREGVPIAV